MALQTVFPGPRTSRSIKHEANLARYYRVEIVRGLFGDWGLIRTWGRIERAGQSRTDWFGSEAEAKDACLALHAQKAKRGYE